MIKTAVSYNILLQKIHSLVTETISDHLKNFISKIGVLKTKGLWEVNLLYAPLTLIVTTKKNFCDILSWTHTFQKNVFICFDESSLK